MKKITTILLTVFVALTTFSAIMYTSCKKDPCSGVTCLNGGACNGSGKCDCLANYSGDKCETAINQAFAGRYVGTDCGGASAYTITANSADPTAIIIDLAISGTCAVDITLVGTVDAVSKTLDCPTQNFHDGCGNSISIGATGELVGSNEISLSFHVVSGGTAGNCNFSGTK